MGWSCPRPPPRLTLRAAGSACLLATAAAGSAAADAVAAAGAATAAGYRLLRRWAVRRQWLHGRPGRRGDECTTAATCV